MLSLVDECFYVWTNELADQRIENDTRKSKVGVLSMEDSVMDVLFFRHPWRSVRALISSQKSMAYNMANHILARTLQGAAMCTIELRFCVSALVLANIHLQHHVYPNARDIYLIVYVLRTSYVGVHIISMCVSTCFVS